MLIGERFIEIEYSGKKQKMKISVFSPVESQQSWTCRYQINWPDRPVTREVGGVDALQAVLLAFYMIGSDLYFSIANQERRLSFDGVTGQFGFPLHASLRSGVQGYVDI